MDQNKLNELLMLENRILEDRQTLVNITRNTSNLNPEFARQKIAILERDIDDMSRQISYLKGVYAKNADASIVAGVAQPAMPAQPMQQPAMPAQPMQQPAMPAQPMQQPAMPAQPMQQPAMPAQPMERPPLPVPPARAPFGHGNQMPPMGRPPMQGNAYYGPIMRDHTNLEPADMSQRYASYKKADSDFEKTFGKSFMGIAASVLIFISIILFATLLLPKLNDAAKMVIMYLVSVGFLGVGTYRMRKDKDNKFNISLAGCGLGALFISLLLSNIYFGVLGDILLYILIAFWGALVCLYAKDKNYIFQIIGEIGILIATAFGCILCIGENDYVKFIALLIFYGITSTIFYIVNYEREFEDNICYHFYAMVGSGILCLACMFGDGDNWTICTIIAICIQTLNMVGIFTHKIEKQQEIFGFISSVYMVSLAWLSCFTITDEEIWGIVVYGLGMAMVVISTYRKKEPHIGLGLLSITSIIISMIGIIVNGDAYLYGVVWLMIIPLMLFGYFRNNSIFKGASVIIMLAHLFIHDYDEKEIHFAFMLIAFIVLYGCMFWFKEQYNKTFKELVHILALLFIATKMGPTMLELLGANNNDEAAALITSVVYICFFALNTLCHKTKFAHNFITGEEEKNADVYIVANMFAMAWGMVIVSDNVFIVSHLINILVALAAFMLGTKTALEKKDNCIANNIYVGGKFTLFLIVVLLSFDSVSYVISICCLILAISFILIGFVGGYKYLRIYGLVLTIISIFKLIMIDMHYENTLGNAISFFVSGVLCFAISMIYNYLDKKMGNKE